MFKSGDEIICINNNGMSFGLKNLYIVGESYTVSNSCAKIDRYAHIENEIGSLPFRIVPSTKYQTDEFYFYKYFKNVSEIRRNKIKTIL